MEYLNIIEENFSHSDYVTYLRGRIIMYLLEDKPLDTVEFKMYADKLVDALDKEQPNQQDYYRPTIIPQIKSFDYTQPEPTVDADEPQVQPTTIDEPRAYEFKIGDRVVVSKGNVDERTGTVTRLTKDGFIDLTHRYSVVFGNDGKQTVYQSMDGSVEQYRVCQIL